MFVFAMVVALNLIRMMLGVLIVMLNSMLETLIVEVTPQNMS